MADPLPARAAATPRAAATTGRVDVPAPCVATWGPEHLVIGKAAAATPTQHPPDTALSHQDVRVPLCATMDPAEELRDRDITVDVDSNGLKAAASAQAYRLAWHAVLDQSERLREMVVHLSYGRAP